MIGEFTAVTVTGEPLTRSTIDRETLVAFFSRSCAPCREVLRTFVRYAKAVAAPQARPIAVVVGDDSEADAMIAQLRPVARVVMEAPDGAVGAAFGAERYPTVLRVAPRDGALVVTDNRVAMEDLVDGAGRGDRGRAAADTARVADQTPAAAT